MKAFPLSHQLNYVGYSLVFTLSCNGQVKIWIYVQDNLLTCLIFSIYLNYRSTTKVQKTNRNPRQFWGCSHRWIISYSSCSSLAFLFLLFFGWLGLLFFFFGLVRLCLWKHFEVFLFFIPTVLLLSPWDAVKCMPKTWIWK